MESTYNQKTLCRVTGCTPKELLGLARRGLADTTGKSGDLRGTAADMRGATAYKSVTRLSTVRQDVARELRNDTTVADLVIAARNEDGPPRFTFGGHPVELDKIRDHVEEELTPPKPKRKKSLMGPPMEAAVEPWKTQE